MVEVLAANLQEAVFFGTSFKGAGLQKANLQGGVIDFAHLQGASLSGANLQGQA
jgi:uncharacterized protein YjbI with pentapeptide repeats